MSMKPETESHGTDWWQKMLTRREANQRLAKISLAAAALATVGGLSSCGSDEETIEETAESTEDALALQKEEGWNVGMEDRRLTLANKTAADSQNSMDWISYRDPQKLLSAWSPTDSTWEPFVVPTLVQSLSQPSLQQEIAPVHTASMDEAYSRGLGMKEILRATKDPSNTLVVVDIPGPEAVAYGAALSDVANVVVSFDNWPHPAGVVGSDQTLGAMLYYAQEVEKQREKRPDDAPTVLLLDANRLADYTDSGDKFDNRYVAKLPPSDKLKSIGVENVMYAVSSQSVQNEADDINEDFVAYGKQGLNVTMFPLSEFQPANDVPDSVQKRYAESGTHHRPYYYGGGFGYMPLFFSYYPLAYAFGSPMYRGTAPRTVSRPNYSPTPRQTMFSSRTVGGGASGVGRSKPTGFGRVSTRSTGTGSRTFSTRSSSSRSSGGRSGSFGRSSSGRSS